MLGKKLSNLIVLVFSNILLLSVLFVQNSYSVSQLSQNYSSGMIIVKFKATEIMKHKLQVYQENIYHPDSDKKSNDNLQTQLKKVIPKLGIISIDELNIRHKILSIKKLFPDFKIANQTKAGLNEIEAPDLSTVYMLSLPQNSNVLAVIEDYAKDPNIEYAEPNYIYHTCDIIPNDPNFSDQWSLMKIRAPKAWEITKGDNSIIFGIIDTGIDYNHTDLSDNIWNNFDEIPNNGVDDDHNMYVDDIIGWDFVDLPPNAVGEGEDPGPTDNDPMDCYNHGTLVAGIIGACTNNSIGISGTAWNCKLMPLRSGYLDTFGKGTFQVSFTAPAICYAANNGASIINLSYGGYESLSYTEKSAIDYAVSKGCIIVAAAGNENSRQKFYPACYENVIAVGSTDQDDHKASNSNYGEWIDLVAPGVNIYTTSKDNSYGMFNGTSLSSPLVCGVLALVKSIHPDWSNVQLTNQLKKSALPIILHEHDYNGKFGEGRINALNALVDSSCNINILSYFTNDRTQDQNGWIDPGETIELFLRIINQSPFDLTDTYCELSTDDDYISINQDSAYFGQLTPSENIFNINPFAFTVSTSCPTNHSIPLYVIYHSNETIYKDSLTIKMKSPFFQKHWPQKVDLPINCLSDPTVVDLDQDGDKEIIVIAAMSNMASDYGSYYNMYCKVYVFDNNGNLEEGWPVNIINSSFSTSSYKQGGHSPVVADLDYNGDNEIILSLVSGQSSHGEIVILNHDGSYIDGWPKRVSTWGSQSISVFDIDNDNDLEIFMETDSLYAWHHNGENVQGWPIYIHNAYEGSIGGIPSFGDIDNDGEVEVVCGTHADGNYVYAFNSDGTTVPGWPISYRKRGAEAVVKTVSIADINNDGYLEIIGFLPGDCNEPPKIHVWKGEGSELENWPFTFSNESGLLGLDSYFAPGPTLSDLDNDGFLEIILALTDCEAANPLDDHQLIVINHDGIIRNGWPKILSEKIRHFDRGPVTADIDNDNEKEILICSLRDGFLYAFNSDGSNEQDYPIVIPNAYANCGGIVVNDIDKSGDFEILFCIDDEIYVYTGFGSSSYDKLDWSQDKHDNWNTGLYGFEIPPLVVPVELASFHVILNDNIAFLEWETASETNNYGFEIQRIYQKYNSNKKDDWSRIGFVHGSGSTSLPNKYSFSDTLLSQGKYLYRLKQIDTDGGFEYSPGFEIEFNRPSEFVLYPNFPNPFNPATKIEFQVKQEVHISLVIYNILGQEIKTLIDEIKPSGKYEIIWDGTDLKNKEMSSGIYIYQLKAGNFNSINKMTLIR